MSNGRRTMILELKRIFRGNDYTIGKLYIDGEYFCDTLEDTDRGLTNEMSVEEVKSKKVYSKTAIPTGEYKVEITYSPKFKRNLPLICNVKGFIGIRIHNGNDNSHTEGCILVGNNKVKGKVIDSIATTNKLMRVLEREKAPITIKIS